MGQPLKRQPGDAGRPGGVVNIMSARADRIRRLGRPDLAAMEVRLVCDGCGLRHVGSYPPEALGPFPCPWCDLTKAEREQ